MHKVLIAMLMTAILLIAGSVLSAAQLTDQAVSDAVEDELRSDRAIPAGQIEVQTTGGMVILRGKVDNALARDLARKVAETVKGVIAVDNKIRVNPPDVISDKATADNVKSLLAANPATDSYQTSITVSKGVVILAGTVNSFQEKQLVEKVAKGVIGVKAVANNIEVSYNAPRPDAEITEDIQQALRWDALVYDSGIDIDVNDGMVKLSGNVASAAEKSRALDGAYVPGVKAIDGSALKVSDWDRRDRFSANKLALKSDKDIKKALERRLLFEPQVDANKISVEVSKGAATLRGKVKTLQAKRAAGEAARTTTGIVRVKNRVKVAPPAGLSDTQIAGSVGKALAADPYVSRYDVKTTANNGIAVLTGAVVSYFEKMRADTVAAGVSGVTAINNNLKVEDLSSILAYDPYSYDYYFYALDWYRYEPFQTTKTDAEIIADIANEMSWSPFVDADQVTVAVSGGVATLTGQVDSWAEFQAAVENALEGGAVAVVNNLQIAS